MILSAQNPKIKLIRALQNRKQARRKENAFVVEGIRLVEEAVNSDWTIRFALYDDSLSERGLALIETLRARETRCDSVSQPLLKTISDTETPQGILAVVEQRDLPLPATLDFVLIPSAVRDPGNLGTLIRTAAAANVQAVFLPPGTADAFAPKTLRAGMGAHFRLPILSMTWEHIRERLSGLTLYLAESAGGHPCWEADLRAPLALILGGEANGADEAARAAATAVLQIPMPGGTESLNVAAAGAILIFEVVRQRRKPRPN